MRVVISQELLSATLSAVIKAVSTRTVNPVLSHVRIVCEEGRIIFTATDGEFTIRREAAVADAEPGKLLAPARLFSDLVSRLPKKDITLETKDSQMHIGVGRSSYDLAIMSDENFPELPEFAEHRMLTLPCQVLKAGLQQTTFSAVKESSTGAVHYTNGVFFSFKGGKLDIVATDGHRLALKRNDGLSVDNIEKDLLLPARVADELERMLPDDEDSAVEVFHHENRLFFKFGNQLVASSLLDVKFPDYERVIPNEIATKVHVPREELHDALQRVLLVCRQKDQNPVTNLRSDGENVLLASDAGEIGKGEEQIAAEQEGENASISLNPSYMVDALKAISGDSVTLNWISEYQPMLVTSSRHPDFNYIVMPIRMD